jgi:hypothetical protein
MMKVLAPTVALTLMPLSSGLSQSLEEQLRPGNEAIQRQLGRGWQQHPAVVGGGSPPFPLFRCDGQRPPMFGAENCPNWRLVKTQEQLIDLQIKEFQARRRARRVKEDDEWHPQRMPAHE